MRDKYLPVGSVVLLNGGSKKIMITGFCTITNNQSEEMFDYCGCLYPEGIIRSDQNCVFNHSQIKEICFIGYESDEESEFKKKLNDFVNDEDNKDSNLDDDVVEIEKLEE